MDLIPLEVDFRALVAGLNAAGIKDHKIEMLCGFSKGYVAQLRCGNIGRMSFNHGARLYNLWLVETASPQSTGIQFHLTAESI